MQTYWCSDDTGAFYVLRKSLPSYGSTANGRIINNVQEAFVFLPIDNKTDKCLVLFFSEFNYGSQGHPLIFNSHTQDKIKVMRMDLLAAFIEYSKCYQENKIKELYQTTKAVEDQIKRGNFGDDIF